MKIPNRPDLTLLRQRAELLRELRQYLDAQGFLEVQPPCLSTDCIVDPYIDPIEISSAQLNLATELPERLYLQTSPEAAMKRMLAAGAPSIYSIGPVFRSGERGSRHNSEFTMLEWYQVGATLDDGVRQLGELATTVLRYDQYDLITYRELFVDRLGFDPLDAPIELLQSAVAMTDVSLTAADRDELLDILMTQRIEPSLGRDRPLVVKNYPITQAALACTAADDPECAARFELFVSGMELANGYDELRDVDELRRRIESNNHKRIVAGRPPLHPCPKLIEAMSAGFPQCAGVALGVDRLLMVRCGATTIGESIAFPIEIA